MKDRKYSDTSDAFLCQILSKKCNQFLSSCTTQKLTQTIKVTCNPTNPKTILTQSKLTYSHLLTSSSTSTSTSASISGSQPTSLLPPLRASQSQQLKKQETDQLRKKQEQLLTELMRHIVENIRIQLEDVLVEKTMLGNNKHTFRVLLEILEEEYALINQELVRVRKYTMKKEIREVINLDIDIVRPCQFVQLIFYHLPKLKEFFDSFDIEVFTNHQIEEFREQCDLIYEIVDIDSLIEKRIKQKRLKKRNKKKRNKQRKQQIGDSNNEGFELDKLIPEEEEEHNWEIKVAEYLHDMKIGPERTYCGVSEDWLTKISMQYVQ